MEKSLYQPKSDEWFIERIGKRIYRDKLKHCCSVCDHVGAEGLIVHDHNHATYLAMVDGCFANEGVFMNYRDEA